FTKGIRVTIEHGTNNDHEADYSSVAYYYLAGPTPKREPLPNDPAFYLASELPKPKKLRGAIEAEDLVPSAKATDGPVEVQSMDAFQGEYSGGAQLWRRPTKANDTLTFDLPAPNADTYELID